MGGISGFLLVFPGVIALTHEWTDFVRRLVAVRSSSLCAKNMSRIAFGGLSLTSQRLVLEKRKVQKHSFSIQLNAPF